MARHSGKNLKVEANGNFIDGCTGFDYEEGVGDVDLTAAGDGAETHDTTQTNWSGSISMKLDNDAAANQTLRAGDSITIAGYTEGDASGKRYMTGTASVIGNKGSTTYNGETTREYSLKGNGSLAFVDVA
ncbi:MAG: hypothetical protein ABJL67_13480 [Sulfitobacter sp.]